MKINEMLARLREIATEAETAEGETLNKLITEADELKAKIEDAQNRKKLQSIADNLEDEPEDKGKEEILDKAAERGKALKEGKAVTFKNAISSTTTVMPKHTADDVNPAFNDVSSLVDLV